MTAWHRNEYILKGVFLGLWAFAALQVAVDPSAVRVDLWWVLGWMTAGLVLGLIGGTALQLKRGVRPWQNWTAFPLLVLLESPTFVYGGVVFGLAAGVLSGREFAEPWAAPIAHLFGLTFDDIRHVRSDDNSKPGDWLGYCAVGGALLGFGLYRLRQIADPWWRLGVGLALGAAFVYLGGEYANKLPGLDAAARFNLGVYILIGLPFFYLLTFCAEAEESEVEIMALCAAMGTALHLMNIGGAAVNFAAVPLLLPVTIYFVYATRVLPGLRVFKHVLRGYSYQNLGRLREALYFFRRAAELDPKSTFAAAGMRGLHENLTLAKLDREPELIEILDFGLCLDRAERFLLAGRTPTPAEREEADRFLDLVARKKPAYQARVDYLRAVSLTHAKDYPAAAATLATLLDPETPGYHAGVRRSVLFPAWELALKHGPAALQQRLGWAELDKPGRRIEAIAAAERAGADGQELKTLLYSQLTEAEFVAASAGGPPAEFNYEYVEQLGLALVDDADPERRERGAAYLRIAGRGLPERGPSIFRKLADAAPDAEAARGYLDQVKRTGLDLFKAKRLAAQQREIYLAALQQLADLDDARGDPEAAIGSLGLYLEAGGRNELEVFRRRAELYAKAGDSMNALVQVETGLTYSSSDADLLKKKDSYYFSVTEEQLRAKRERVAGFFDVAYCVKKASGILNGKSDDPELLEWASHLAALATVMQPAANGVRLIRARCLLRQGNRDAGLALLEDIRESPKGSRDDEDAWYAATKILGELYLDELQRPDLAIAAFKDYKGYLKAGADTHYQLGRAYEAAEDTANAIREYDAVTAFEGHPRFWDAKDALRRLGRP
ncbi:MAG: tetratricopeptide repeat protein [Gemmataceae bacterium]